MISYLGAMDANARKDDYWPLIVEFVEEWIDRLPVSLVSDPFETMQIRDAWREEMS